MADNISVLEADGVTTRTVAADDISSVLYNRVKLIFGADGVNSGDVSSSNPLPVKVYPQSVSSVSAETNVSVTTSSGVALASNASRKGGWVRNISDVDMFVSLSGTATTSKPTKLAPFESMSFMGQDGVLYTGDVAAIHAGSGSKTLEVVEK